MKISDSNTLTISKSTFGKYWEKVIFKNILSHDGQCSGVQVLIVVQITIIIINNITTYWENVLLACTCSTLIVYFNVKNTIETIERWATSTYILEQAHGENLCCQTFRSGYGKRPTQH